MYYNNMLNQSFQVGRANSVFILDKGQKEELEALYETLKGNTKDWPIALEDMIQTTEATFLINN